jgi:hypothetical protein
MSLIEQMLVDVLLKIRKMNSTWTQKKFSPKCSRLKKDMQELQDL